jgi:hypothetical protein
MTRLQESPDSSQADTFEQRWQAWQARGRAREQRTRGRLRFSVAALILFVASATLWLVFSV